MLNRKIAPPIKDAMELGLHLAPYKKYTLKNGVDVIAVDLGELDVVMVNWIFYAGNWFEEKNLVATTTSHLLKNGTSKKSAFEINEHFEYHGAYLSRSCSHELADITLHAMNKNIGELLPVVAELLADSVFPENELEIYKKNMRQRLKVSLMKSEFVAGRLIDAYLFGKDHPYGQYSSDEEYNALQQPELKAFYQRYYQNGRCMIFVAGKLPSNLIQQLDDHFGSLPLKPINNEFEIPDRIIQPAREKKYHITNDPNGVQASIRIARNFPNRHHPDFQKMQVLNTLFGGYFGSRLMSNIREDKGYTYGIHSYLMNQIQESALLISTEAGKDVGEATITEVYRELQLLCDEIIDEEELKVTRNYLIGTLLGDLDGPFQVAGRWKNIILNGLDENYFYQGIEVIKTITPKELQELANRYLAPANFYELVVI